MGKRHAIEWAKKHIKQRQAKVIETKNGLYVFDKDSNEPELYKDYDDYAIYNNPYGYKDFKTKRINHLRK